MLANAKDKDSILYDGIKDKEYVLHTLKALSVLDVTKEMEEEMRIDVEEWIKKPAGFDRIRVSWLSA